MPLDPKLKKLRRLEKWLHSLQLHPDYEYETTQGPRKIWYNEDRPPNDDSSWKKNLDKAGGWERFEYHEESYWRRKQAKGKLEPLVVKDKEVPETVKIHS